MINKSFYVWSNDDKFKGINAVEIYINSNGGIRFRDVCEDDLRIEMLSLIILSPDMVDDVIEALRVLKSEMQ